MVEESTIGFDKIFPNPKKQIEFVMKQKYKDIKKLWVIYGKIKIKLKVRNMMH